jgi:protein-tyrosine-phosphatase
MVEDLCAEFSDRFDRGRIEDLMADSVRQLAVQAEVTDFLPVLAYRFTRERLGSIARSAGTDLDVVFISLSGGGRGQIAAALTTLLSGGRVSVHAAGTAALGVVDPITEAVIGELGIDMSDSFARPVSGEILAGADVIVTMGHSVGSVELPAGVKHEDWRVGDPVGASLAEARRVRDDIERRVRELLTELHALAPADLSDEDERDDASTAAYHNDLSKR